MSTNFWWIQKKAELSSNQKAVSPITAWMKKLAEAARRRETAPSPKRTRGSPGTGPAAMKP